MFIGSFIHSDTHTHTHTHTVSDSLSLQDTPATVRILHGDAGVAACLQVAGLDRNLGDLRSDMTGFYCEGAVTVDNTQELQGERGHTSIRRKKQT